MATQIRHREAKTKRREESQGGREEKDEGRGQYRDHLNHQNFFTILEFDFILFKGRHFNRALILNVNRTPP